MPPISAKASKSAILLIDVQNAFLVPDFWGKQRNNDQLEKNVQNLVENTRRWNKEQRSLSQNPEIETANTVDIIHVRHHSTGPGSPLNPSFMMPIAAVPSTNVESSGKQQSNARGIDAMACAQEIEGEPIFVKSVNSAFIGTSLEQHLRERNIRQLLVCGITTDHCVSTSIRMAANLKAVNSADGTEQGNILIIEDCCATFERGDYPADLVHKVQIESLRNEFAEVTTTQEVLKQVLS